MPRRPPTAFQIRSDQIRSDQLSSAPPPYEEFRCCSPPIPPPPAAHGSGRCRAGRPCRALTPYDPCADPGLSMQRTAGGRFLVKWQAPAGATQLYWAASPGPNAGWQPVPGAIPLPGGFWQAEFLLNLPRLFRVYPAAPPVPPPNVRLVMTGDHFRLEWTPPVMHPPMPCISAPHPRRGRRIICTGCRCRRRMRLRSPAFLPAHGIMLLLWRSILPARD